MDDAKPQEKQQPLVSLNGLCHALSTERLGAYSDEADRDSTDAVARYLWNGALCIAFHPSLHALEVTFRNILFRASQPYVSTAGRTCGIANCWLDATPTFLLPREADQLRIAKERIGPNPKFQTSGRLIAQLGFGFWTALCQAPYEHGRPSGPRLWPALLPHVFPHLPRKQRQRSAIAHQLDSIREWRNRIAHHEPVWDRDVLRQYDEILETIAWIHPAMRNAARACSNLELIYHGGVQQFRSRAATILGSSN